MPLQDANLTPSIGGFGLSKLGMSSTEIRISRLAVEDVGTGGDPLEQIATGGGHVAPPTAPNGQ